MRPFLGQIGDAVNWPWELRIGYSPDREFTNELSLTLNLLTQNSQATVIDILQGDRGEKIDEPIDRHAPIVALAA